MEKRLKIAVLGSGKGSNFVALAEAVRNNAMPADIVLVASDLAGAKILEEAGKRGIPSWTCPPSQFKTRLEPELEEQLASKLLEAGAELVVLAGYMRVIKMPLLQAFPRRIINIHPSLLPKFPGLRAWAQALEAGESITGCTVHWVNAVVDGGETIARREVPILPGDTAESLHARIQVAEHEVLPAVVGRIARGEIPLG
jgi:phosphoribosylglycinamide formyltransferase-1